MAFPFASPGDPDYVDTPDPQPQSAQPKAPATPKPASPPTPAPVQSNQINPRESRPFSTTKLVAKSASATTLFKLAHTKSARTWSQFLVGDGFSTMLDPNQRGLATDMAAYSNPISGTVFGINDTARHLYNGNYGNALGSLGMTALSFLPGGGALGAGARGVVKGVGMAGAKALAPTAARAGGRGITNAMAAFGRRSGIQAVDDAARGVNTFAQQGMKTVNTGQQAITNTLQKVPGLRPAANPAQGWKSWASPSAYKDWAVQNPALAAGTFGHQMGVNSNGESLDDIANRHNAGFDDMQARLQQMNQ